MGHGLTVRRESAATRVRSLGCWQEKVLTVCRPDSSQNKPCGVNVSRSSNSLAKGFLARHCNPDAADRWMKAGCSMGKHRRAGVLRVSLALHRQGILLDENGMGSAYLPVPSVPCRREEAGAGKAIERFAPSGAGGQLGRPVEGVSRRFRRVHVSPAALPGYWRCRSSSSSSSPRKHALPHRHPR